MKSPGVACEMAVKSPWAAGPYVEGQIVEWFSSGLFTAHIWQLRSLLSDTFSVHKTKFPYGPWKRPGRASGPLPTALCAALVRGIKEGVRGCLVTQLPRVLCASVQFSEDDRRERGNV